MRILITGICGFIAHHFVEHFLKNSDLEIVGIDCLTYASNGFNRLRDISAYDDKRVKVVGADFTKPLQHGVKQEIGQVDYIVHMGAETHVDNSIVDPEPFVRANVLGTMNVLNFAKEQENLKKFIYFSTDEVFGPANNGESFKEWDRYNSANPYAASKAGGEELALAYANTYKLPITITHTMNIYGERQHPEKFIPSVISKCLYGGKVFIHADSTKTIPGSRQYIHARNVANAVDYLLTKSNIRDKYNIVGEKEVSNLDLALLISEYVGESLDYELVDFHSSRPGHDLRYALDGTKMREIGWEIPINFEESLNKTVEWYLKPGNRKWLDWDTKRGVENA